MQITTERQLTIVIIGRVIERLLLVIAGVFCIYIGYLLYVGGVSGNVKLIAETTGQKYQLENAAPGVVMALFGTLILIHTTFRPPKYEFESPGGERQTLLLSDSLEQSRSGNLSLDEDEVTSLYRVTFNTLRSEDIDPNIKTHMRKVYNQVYYQLPRLPEEISPDRLP